MSESIKDILREMREFADTDSQSIGRDVLRREIQHFADRIEAAHRRELDEVARVLGKLAEGICSHCDMQIDCAEGVDGMSTMCNAMYDVKKFIEEHRSEEGGKR